MALVLSCTEPRTAETRSSLFPDKVRYCRRRKRMVPANISDKVSSPPSTLNVEEIVPDETSLVARPEALKAFRRMQAAAELATMRAVSPLEAGDANQDAVRGMRLMSCCLIVPRWSALSPARRAVEPPKREYYPENISIRPLRHPWTEHVEWLLIACIDFLEKKALHELRLFAVSAVDDSLNDLQVDIGYFLPSNTDPHVAAGVIKMKLRNVNEPLASKDCLTSFIDLQNAIQEKNVPLASEFESSHLATAIEITRKSKGQRRAYIFARLIRLLGLLTANSDKNGMSTEGLAKCVAPSLLHWDPNSRFSLLMLGKITSYVMKMTDEARLFCELLRKRINSFTRK